MPELTEEEYELERIAEGLPAEAEVVAPAPPKWGATIDDLTALLDLGRLPPGTVEVARPSPYGPSPYEDWPRPTAPGRLEIRTGRPPPLDINMITGREPHQWGNETFQTECHELISIECYDYDRTLRVRMGNHNAAVHVEPNISAQRLVSLINQSLRDVQLAHYHER